jgi:hypothetical protein
LIFKGSHEQLIIFDLNNGRRNGPSSEGRFHYHNNTTTSITIVQMPKPKIPAKVNYIKLNINCDGERVLVGQFYQFWIGGSWLQAAGSLGRVSSCVGLRWVFVSSLPLTGTCTIKSANAKVFLEQQLRGRFVKVNLNLALCCYNDDDDILQTNVYCSLPLRLMSRGWGWLADRQVPVTLRPSIFGLYSTAFGVNLEEAVQSDLK